MEGFTLDVGVELKINSSETGNRKLRLTLKKAEDLLPKR